MSCPAGFTFDSMPQKAPYAEMTETLEPGMRVEYCGQTITWSENHLPASRLEPLRRIGDELADKALEALKIKAGQDAYKVLLAYVSRPEHEQESPAPRLLMKQVMTVPEWVDWEQVRRGQQVFWRYCLFIHHILLHFSLTGGFSLPKITKVLTSTGYLSGSKSKERVYETSQFVFDIAHSLEHLTPGTGPAWESIIQVRFLHAGVRARLSRVSRAHSKYYSVEEHGVPINQEDLLGTLFSFSNTVWRVMEARLNIIMSQQEREDYLHLWRYVGYVMGVDDLVGATRSPELADACLESIVLHLSDPNEEGGKLAASLLKSMAAGPTMTKVIHTLGLPDPFKFHLVLAESLLGEDFWKLNGLPSMPRPYWFLQKMLIWMAMMDLKLVSWLPWWFQLRSHMLLQMYNRLITRTIGKKRTQFELKEVPKTAQQDGEMSRHPMEGFRVADRLWPMVLTAASFAIAVGYFR
ncbi:MAG: hypothetical protein J3Q66DRAFT_427315 [Benniella sp.]|nr:MAG: hypothetical protein J3Q66DRAFT_427315 [Benniella sp.]